MTEALGLYIHWPYCARICPYCDFNVYKVRGADDALFEAICRDLVYWAERLERRPLASIHFGGGTPSLMSPDQVSRLITLAEARFGFDPTIEIGLEANPNDEARFADFAKAGINRLSLGVQSLEDKALLALGRDHDASLALKSIEAAQASFDRVSADMIYAREGQTLEDWQEELSRLLELGLRHLSLYQLTIEPGTAFAKRVERGELKPPDNDMAASFLELTDTVLADKGLTPYETSNYCTDLSHQSRHNSLYWQGADWIGIGPGAHGRIGAHASGGRLETATVLRPDEYVERLAVGKPSGPVDTLSAIDEARERILMGLRLTQGLNRPRIRQLTGFDVDPLALSALTEQGLIIQTPEYIRLTHTGRLLGDGVAAELCP